MTGKIAKSVGGTLIDLIMSGGRSASRNVPPDLASSVAIARNALSNVPEIPVNVAEQLRLGPLTGRVARDAYGGDDLLRRGALLGEGNFSAAPGPKTTYRPSSPGEIIRNTQPTVSPQAPRPEFDVPGAVPRGFTGSSPGEIIGRTPSPSAPAPQAAVTPQAPMVVRPTGTTNNAVQGRLDLRNPAGSVANQPSTNS